MKIQERIVKCAEILNIDKEELLGKSRKGKIASIRNAVIGLLRENRYTLVKIGEVFNRHHTTIMNAVEKHYSDLATSREYSGLYRKLKEAFNEK